MALYPAGAPAGGGRGRSPRNPDKRGAFPRLHVCSMHTLRKTKSCRNYALCLHALSTTPSNNDLGSLIANQPRNKRPPARPHDAYKPEVSCHACPECSMSARPKCQHQCYPWSTRALRDGGFTSRARKGELNQNPLLLLPHSTYAPPAASIDQAIEAESYRPRKT